MANGPAPNSVRPGSFFFQKNGPVGIRTRSLTHAMGARYRCATGPNYFFCNGRAGQRPTQRSAKLTRLGIRPNCELASPSRHMDAPGIEPGASPVLEHNMPCEGCVLPMNYAPEYNMRIYRLARFKKLLIRATDYSRLSRM